MKKPIKITIPDTLSPEEEAVEIGYQLYKKALPEHTQNSIGTGLGIKQLRTEIIIERVGEKPIEFMKCPVCGNEHQSNIFKKVFTNYGGVNRTIKTCSLGCAESLIDICGVGRASLSRKKLIPVSFFPVS